MDPHPRLHQQDHGIREGEMQADDPKGMEAMEKKLEEIEDEASAQKEMQSKVAQGQFSFYHLPYLEFSRGLILALVVNLDEDASAVDDAVVIQAKKEESDSRSIFVGNVDYACTPEEIQQHFESCGTVNRVTILTDKFGQPKGYAYVEFVEIDAVQNAVLLSESELHGRQLKVSAKRTNVPGRRQYWARRPNPYMAFGSYMPASFYPPYVYRAPRFRRPMRYRPY